MSICITNAELTMVLRLTSFRKVEITTGLVMYQARAFASIRPTAPLWCASYWIPAR